MNVVRLIGSFFLVLVLVKSINLELNGQVLEPGTQYFDDIRGDETVVTNAWNNVSNRVHQLIQVASPTPTSIKDDFAEMKPDGSVTFFQTRWIAHSGSNTYILKEDGNNRWVFSSESVSAELTWVDNYWRMDLGGGFNAEIHGNEDATSLTFSFIDESVWSLSKEGNIRESKFATTNIVAEMIATNKYSHITDGINTISADMSFTSDDGEYFLSSNESPYPLSNFTVGVHAWGFAINLNYNENVMVMVKDLPPDIQTPYHFMINFNTLGEFEYVLDKRRRTGLLALCNDVTNIVNSLCVTNDTVNLPMTDSSTRERVYLKVENGEVNIYKVQ